MYHSYPACKTKENLYAQLQKNNVDSKNQLAESSRVHFTNLDGKGKRIMFVGNSMTLHGIRPSIGWNGEYGMAASKKENDYVHLLMAKTNEVVSDSQFCICQVADWERAFDKGEETLSLYENARNFNANIIIMRFIENCPKDNFDLAHFKEKLSQLLDYLNKSQKAKLIITTGFWRHPGDQAIIEYAKENNLPCVLLGDLGEQDEMKAIGLFEHKGVANHPGDLGMKHMADRIWEELEKLL